MGYNLFSTTFLHVVYQGLLPQSDDGKKWTENVCRSKGTVLHVTPLTSAFSTLTPQYNALQTYRLKKK